MKKVIALILVAAFMLTALPVQAQKAAGRGGFMGFIAGCCFGIRAGMAYNDGKEIHWREWCRIVPFVSIVIAIWDGIDCANGKTTTDFAAQYGAMYY
ncbi:MAG TPA: hypothetical protein PLE77_01470 [Kiritimatiellia bacterium]|nr:hypothetical protein [Kiritimatiellia bacterium]